MTISRVISGVITIIYLIIAFLVDGLEGMLDFIMFLMLPLVCIWFSDEMGSYTGLIRGHLITSESPGWLVAFLGWILLLFPVIICIITAMI
ncbi:MAG: hypothetical protein SV062_09980 [Thermodesulfobacteriota bacterium]|nr:hypothetical protein [Thermodesulfobacteriota bacterium]